MPRNRRRATRGNNTTINVSSHNTNIQNTTLIKETSIKCKTRNSNGDDTSSFESESESESESSSSSSDDHSLKSVSKLPLVDFIHSTKFVGPRKGYVFKNGDQGLGYYLDDIPSATSTAQRIMDKSNKISSRSSYDPRFALPTTSEMQQLRQTEGTINNNNDNISHPRKTISNMMELKFASLLKHVTIDYNSLKDLEQCLFTLKSLLNNITPFKMDESSPIFQKYKGLHPLWKHHTKPISFQFEKPTRIDLVGSYLLHSIIKPNCNVDITIQIPNSCFVPKDILDYRYHDKRRLYLSAIANELSKEVSFTDIEIQGWREGNDISKPILVFKLASDANTNDGLSRNDKKRKKTSGHRKSRLAQKFTIRIYPIIGKDVFDTQKLNPSKGNLRLHKQQNNDGNTKTNMDERKEFTKVPTPRYNCTILEDMYMRDHLQTLHQTASKCKGFIGACQLLKMWLHRRDMLHAPDTFNGFLISMLTSDLLSKNEINNNASAKQIFKKVIAYISKNDFGVNGYVMYMNNKRNTDNGNNDSALKKHVLNVHLKSHDVVMLDHNCLLNVTSRVSLDAYNELRHQAKLSHRFLKHNHGSSAYSFDPLFLGQNSKVTLWSKYDIYAVLPSVDHLADDKESSHDLLTDGHNSDNISNTDRSNNEEQYWKQETLQHIHDILSRALNDRARLIRVVWGKRDKNSWNCMRLKRKQLPLRNIVVCILLEPSTFARTLDRGPNAEDKSSAALFRKFWGEKSELRRFKDGSIVEAILWHHKYGNQYSVLSQILKYILSRHLKYAMNCRQLTQIKVSSNQLNQLLQPVFKSLLSADDLFKRLRQTLDDLAIKITSLDTLPLRVTTLQFTSSGGRYTMEHPPVFHPLLGNVEEGLKDHGYASKVIKPHGVMVSLESSGRWPDDLFAIQKVKTAFLCSLGASLRKFFHIKSLARHGALDVAYEGYAFRLNIICEREKELLTIAASKIPVIVGGKRKFVFDNRKMVTQAIAEKRFKQLRIDTDIKILHSNFVHSLQLRFSVYGEVVRLAKHWLHSKMLSDVFPEEMIEILVASLFVDPSCRPHEPPSSFVSGFLRFLELLVYHEWEYEPLIIDLDGSISPNDITTIEATFEREQESVLQQQKRHNCSADESIFYVVTSYDRESKWVPSWVENNTISSLYLKRCIALAKETKYVIRGSNVISNAIHAFKPPSRKEYDAVIYLIPENIPCQEYPIFNAEKGRGRDSKVAFNNSSKKYKHINEQKGSSSKFGQRFRVETYRNASTKDPLDRLIFDFDPFTKYINELRKMFGHLAFFFRDSYKGHSIGVIWNPAAFQPSKFKVGNCAMKLPLHDFDVSRLKKQKADNSDVTDHDDRERMVWPNQTEILEEIKLLGKGFTKCIKM